MKTQEPTQSWWVDAKSREEFRARREQENERLRRLTHESRLNPRGPVAPARTGLHTFQEFAR